MICESCRAEKTKVTQSLPTIVREIPTVVRKRHCAVCGYKFSTTEQPDNNGVFQAQPLPKVVPDTGAGPFQRSSERNS